MCRNQCYFFCLLCMVFLVTGSVYKYDISLPPQEMYGLVQEMRKRLVKEGLCVLGFGHLGDGNLHLNISDATRIQDKKLIEDIEPFVYEWTCSRNGSISAEHGLGLMRAEYLHFSKNTLAIEYMSHLKKLLDPNGILNPYKVLPSDA